MRISNDARRCVVFLGVADDTPGGPGIRCVGTAFLLAYGLFRYLVTVKHVALGLAGAPFLIRMNNIEGGGSANVDVEEDQIRWFTHPDPSVDLAIAPFHYDLRSAGYDVKVIAGIENTLEVSGFECGDFCYTIGLFQLLAGQKRNLPVVHFGTIALLPGDEKIPVRDWDNAGRGTKFVEGYLVESQSIQGLSGAPVLGRAHVESVGVPTDDGTKVDVLFPRKEVGLLGVWQGAWDAPPDETYAKIVGQNVRVPVGMGVVVPCSKIVEILEMQDAKEDREKIKKAFEAMNAASPDSVPPLFSSPTSD